jgi:hypothetical protein
MKVKQKRDKNRTVVFFYHSRDISIKQILEIYKNICENKDSVGESFIRMTTQLGGTMEISKLIVAYNKAKNLCDILCSNTFKDPD